MNSRYLVVGLLAVVMFNPARAAEIKDGSGAIPSRVQFSANSPSSKRTESFGELVRAIGLDASSLGAELRERESDAISSIGFAQLFCPTHKRFEWQIDAPDFSVRQKADPIDPLAQFLK